MKIIVIGAGVFGASVAYHLARTGAEIVVLDRADPGRASAAGAGIICPWLRETDPAYYHLARLAASYYRDLLIHLGSDGEGDISYRQVGSIVIPQDAALLDGVEARLRRRRDDAPEMGEVRRLTPGQARDLFPLLRGDRAGLWIEGTARVDGRRLAASLLKATQHHHGIIREAAVDAILVEHGRACGVRVGEDRIAADAVVVATGAWAAGLLDPLGITLSLQPQRGQIIHLRPPGMQTGAWPVLQPLNDHYILAFDDCRVVVGATREFGTGLDYRVTAAGVAGVLGVGLDVAPGLADAAIIETRIGFRPMAFDNRPLAGPVDAIPGLMIANGLGHSGLTLAPYLGKLLADMIGGLPAAQDISAFNPLRR